MHASCRLTAAIPFARGWKARSICRKRSGGGPQTNFSRAARNGSCSWPGGMLAEIEANPLAGVRVVITRAADQSRELSAQLAALGANVILLPAITFAEPKDSAPLDAAIRELASFDWLLFTSANAARFLAARCCALGVQPSSVQSAAKPVFVAAVGPAT